MDVETAARTQESQVEHGGALPGSRLLTRRQVAQRLGYSVSYMAVLACHGKGPQPHGRIGRSLLYRVDEVDAWRAAHPRRSGGRPSRPREFGPDQLTTKEAAALLGLTPAKMAKRMADGIVVPGGKVAGSWWFDKAETEALRGALPESRGE